MSDPTEPAILIPTPAEAAIIKKYIDPLTPEQALQELKADLQIAIEIELATIPIYLFTYYSINRTYSTGEQLEEIGNYANKAGGAIMSVAVEEMLHMSLSSNILFSLGGTPQLYGKSPGPPNKSTQPPYTPTHYPLDLPFHSPNGPDGKPVQLPLSKFSYDQLWQCLEIEYPAAPKSLPEERNWETIGQFYSWIIALIKSGKITDADFGRGVANQIQPDNYSPNNVDTAHPAEAFGPWGIPPAQGEAPPVACPGEATTPTTPSAAAVTVFSNKADAHEGPGKTELVTISNRVEALQAIGTICDQGEGYSQQAVDDPSKDEDSHYYKFLKLQAQLEEYKSSPDHRELLPDKPTPPEPITPTITDADLAKVIFNYPSNPITRTDQWATDQNTVYADAFQPISDLCNGIYQYMLILTETIFRVPSNEQKLFFNEAMHRSMIWVLDKVIQKMRGIPLNDSEGHVLAPTFENIDLGERKDSYANLMKLADAMVGQVGYDEVKYYIGIMKTLPDVSDYW
jgi:hypothetical protein